MKFIATVLLATATTFSVSAYAITSGDQIGHSANGTIAQRTIDVNANTRYVNVQRGDIVEFTAGSNSVVWQFDGVKETIPLSQVFPSAADAQNVTVYVAVEDLH
jgi:hypothetical protein